MLIVMSTIVIALGGNALLRKGERGTLEEQLRNASRAAEAIAMLVARGYRVVVTHGNGPQVGNILIQNEAARNMVPPMPLDACGAESQGLLGYIIQQSIENRLRNMGLRAPVATVITQVVVDPNDEAFRNPTKFIGPFYSEEEAKRLARERGYIIRRDGIRGWRRVVPSPRPIRIVEAEAIRRLIESGVIVIAAGGGGIPVVERNGVLKGVEAVIDKDLTAAKLALEVRAKMLLMLTDVDKVYLNYGTPTQTPLDKLTVDEALRYLAEGHFPPGSMGPKIEAAVEFVLKSEGKAVIAHLDQAVEAVDLKAGTVIVR